MIGKSSIIATPSNDFTINYKIDFEDPAIRNTKTKNFYIR